MKNFDVSGYEANISSFQVVLSGRYERRSVIITSNLVFSQWEKIFKDPMTTAAAIDRVVHHSVIVEFGKEIPSHRAQEAAPPSPLKRLRKKAFFVVCCPRLLRGKGCFVILAVLLLYVYSPGS